MTMTPTENGGATVDVHLRHGGSKDKEWDTEKHTTSHGSHDEALGHMGACCAAHTGTSGAKHEDKHKAANHRAGSSIVKKAMSMVKGGKDY
jgi:hypothetical protein